MNDRELACLVEGSEAAAYASLVDAPVLAIREQYGLTSKIEGSALAVLGRTLPSSLNLNRIIGLGVMEPASEPVLDSLTEFYAQQGLSFAIELSPRAEPQQLAEWLRARRLRKVMATAMHYRAAESMAAVAPAFAWSRCDRKTATWWRASAAPYSGCLLRLTPSSALPADCRSGDIGWPMTKPTPRWRLHCPSSKTGSGGSVGTRRCQRAEEKERIRH